MPDENLTIYQHFRNRKISVQFVDTYWLSSDILRCVGLLNQEIETQLILNLINNTYQNYERDNEDITIRYDALTMDTGELKKIGKEVILTGLLLQYPIEHIKRAYIKKTGKSERSFYRDLNLYKKQLE